jgi:diaminohydroxyphosphoribosylaminopyrimidine deaminase/5-amino-6-(5-phosphoribosylamino)uracil reductase
MRSAFAHLLPSSSSTTWSGPYAAALQAAYDEAVRGVGRTAPNPPVGCVLLDAAGVVVARGFHARAGEPHAEVNALNALLAERGPGAARGLTAVVTLEPCAHHGRTPPCADRLIAEGVARVVVGTLDPNPRVDGRGVERLRTAGIDVVVAESEPAAACAALLAPFTRSMSTTAPDRPWVVLKTATSLDGRVATRTGASRFITGSSSRQLVHHLRDAVDAIVVGANTVLVDDPALTVRDVQRRDGSAVRDPLRVIFDRRCQVPLTARVFDPPGALLVHDAKATPKPIVGVERVALDDFGVPTALQALLARGVTSLLVEAGPRLAAAFIAAQAVDELWWFHAPLIIGGDGAAAVGALGVAALADAPRALPWHHEVLGPDTLTVLGIEPRRETGFAVLSPRRVS